MSKVKELREKQAKLVADAREVLEEIDNTDDDSRAQELDERYEKIMAEHDRIETQVEREEKVATAEERVNAPDPRRPIDPGVETPAGEQEEQQVTHDEAFNAYLRYGLSDLPQEYRNVLKRHYNKDAETRAQSAGTNSEGGFTVPTGFQDELVVSLQAFGPMLNPGITRELVTGMGNQIEWPTMDDTSNKGALLAENTQDSEQDLVFAQKTLDAHKYTSKIIRVSEELLQDSAVDLAGIVRDAMAERLGRIVNEHLTTGDGSGKPNGIVNASTQGQTAAAAGAISFDDLIELVHSVDPAYRNDPNVRFMFHDQTLKALRKLKDDNSNFIWQPANVQTGEPAQLLGYPYSINQDMAQISSTESPSVQEKTVLFGAFNRYIVRRVREFAVRRLVERYADFFQVGFIGMGRFDGELLDTAAVKHLVHPTS